MVNIKKQIIILYLIGIHLLLGVVLLKSDFIYRVERKLGINITQTEITEHFHRMLLYHSRMDGNVPNKSVIFIGDSITQGIVLAAVVTPSVNYGIGSDTSAGVLQRLPMYKSIKNAGIVVIAVGINDMKFRSNKDILFNYQAIAEQIPNNVRILFSAVLPIDEDVRNEWQGRNQRIRELNSALKAWTETSENLFFLDAGSQLIDGNGNLADQIHDGDGVHLNSKGNAILINNLRETIASIQQVATLDGDSVAQHGH